MRFRLKWGISHFTVSSTIVALFGVLIFLVWFPYPYRTLSGGLSLFLLVAVVDVVLGPVCTFAVASPTKRARELRLDVAVIALVQVAALGYGAWTIFQSRPVYLAFEIDRLRVVHAIDVDASLLAQAPDEFRSLPAFGPQLVAVRPFASPQERMEVTMAALQGVDIGARPDLWIEWNAQRSAIQAASLPLSELLKDKPQHRQMAEKALAGVGLGVEGARYLPVAGRRDFWTAVLAPDFSSPVLFLPIDPY